MGGGEVKEGLHLVSVIIRVNIRMLICLCVLLILFHSHLYSRLQCSIYMYVWTLVI